MAVYKVPQDVEADDKLIGPFSFRQFIYLIIVAASFAIAWALSRLLLPLAILPLPIILLFGALALPLRKDQPMETYVAAIISFYLKPRRRLWDPDGIQSLIEITAPRNVEVQRTKDFSQDEAEKRLSYLAGIVDSHGWAVRGVDAPVQANTAMNTDMYFEAQQAEDILDSGTRTAHTIESQLDKSSTRHREDLMARMQQPVSEPAATTQPLSTTPDPYASPSQTQTTPPVADDPHLSINPYPNMQQTVIQPLSDTPQPAQKPTQPTTSEKAPSPDIINLANNPDLSIETIAREANRIQKKESLPDEEVVISLR